MPGCAMSGCKSYSRKTKGSDIRYYSFPKQDDLVKQWEAACKRKDVFNTKNAYVCSIHFTADNFETHLKHRMLNYAPKNYRDLKIDAVPTSSSEEPDTDRRDRCAKRNRKKQVEELLSFSLNHTSDENSIGTNAMETNPVDSFSQENEIRELKNQVLLLNEEIERLKVINKELNDLISVKIKETEGAIPKDFSAILNSCFTTGQIKTLLNPGKRIRWNTDDIAAAISLRSVSPKAYRFLRKHNYPLPGLSTLRTWASALNIEQGVLKDVLHLMKTKSKDLIIDEEHDELLKSFDQATFKESINEDALKYIAGYIAYRFRNTYPDLGTKTKDISHVHNEVPDWLQSISRGNLLYPSADLIRLSKVLDNEFYQLNGDFLSSEKFLFTTLAKRTMLKLDKSITIPYEVVLCFARTRTYIRLRELNRKISFTNCKRKLNKKMSKFTNFKK